jgi:hypothetical protein
MGNHIYENCLKHYFSRPSCVFCCKKNIKCESHTSFELSKCPVGRQIKEKLPENILFSKVMANVQASNFKIPANSTPKGAP